MSAEPTEQEIREGLQLLIEIARHCESLMLSLPPQGFGDPAVDLIDRTVALIEDNLHRIRFIAPDDQLMSEAKAALIAHPRYRQS